MVREEEKREKGERQHIHSNLKGAQPGRLPSLFLLSDGVANISPPRGITFNYSTITVILFIYF
jgi:hypothetical protein